MFLESMEYREDSSFSRAIDNHNVFPSEEIEVSIKIRGCSAQDVEAIHAGIGKEITIKDITKIKNAIFVFNKEQIR